MPDGKEEWYEKGCSILRSCYGLCGARFGRLFKRIIVAIFTLGIGAIIWQLYDTICIATGKINCDRNGTPLV